MNLAKRTIQRKAFSVGERVSMENMIWVATVIEVNSNNNACKLSHDDVLWYPAKDLILITDETYYIDSILTKKNKFYADT